LLRDGQYGEESSDAKLRQTASNDFSNLLKDSMPSRVSQSVMMNVQPTWCCLGHEEPILLKRVEWGAASKPMPRAAEATLPRRKYLRLVVFAAAVLLAHQLRAAIAITYLHRLAGYNVSVPEGGAGAADTVMGFVSGWNLLAVECISKISTAAISASTLNSLPDSSSLQVRAFLQRLAHSRIARLCPNREHICDHNVNKETK
jgi:hypothetical protein